jgi:SET domain-containing protein
MNYRPLPESLTIKPSSIEGLGLFATKTIPKNTDLGMIHFSYGELIIRTPLGGFINHSDKPNCKKLDLEDEWHLKTVTEIKKDQELTLKYTLYTPIL